VPRNRKAEFHRMPFKVSFAHIEDDDPNTAAMFAVASDAHDLVEAILRDIGAREISGADRTNESLRRLILYLGTVFNELFIASAHLGVLEMPRAQAALNRQLFELSVRMRWLLSHPDQALRLMDSLPKFPYEEIAKSGAELKPDLRAGIIANYEAWRDAHEDLDATVSARDRFGEMARDALGVERAGKDMLWYYGVPSIIMHGKPHGIADVMTIRDDGQMERSIVSKWFDRGDELSRALGIALELATLLTRAYGLEQSRLIAMNTRFDGALREQGLEPELVPVVPQTGLA
jgi:hypothetical protein